MYNVHSYAFSFLLLCFYSIQPVYKYLHFIHLMYRDIIIKDYFVIKVTEIMFRFYFSGVIWCNEFVGLKRPLQSLTLYLLPP